MVFNQYAKYYDLLYKSKSYRAEVDYINSLIQQFSVEPVKTILDIGCGTGGHVEYMAKAGYHMTGIDLSTKMIDLALAKHIPDADFQPGDAADFHLSKQFDTVVSLFHVLSYNTKNVNLKKMVANIVEHLRVNGLFIFDFWYGPAVLTKRPSVRIKLLEDDDIKVTRVAEPVLKINEDTVDVVYELLVKNKEQNSMSVIDEVHRMRYFFLPEIELLFEGTGIKLLYEREWLTGNELSESTWYACCVGRKEGVCEK